MSASVSACVFPTMPTCDVVLGGGSVLEGGVVLGGGVYARRGCCSWGGGVWDPKACAPKMVQRNLSLSKFHSFPLQNLVRGVQNVGGGGGIPMPKKSFYPRFESQDSTVPLDRRRE